MKKNKIARGILAVYIVIPIIVSIVLYFLLPIILNYPPNSIDNEFQREIDGLPYTYQFISIAVMGLGVGLVMSLINLKRITKCMKNIEKGNDKQKWLDKITKISVSTPIKLYTSQILIPAILIPIVIASIGAAPVVVLKISSVFILFLSLSATLSYVFSQKAFKRIITQVFENETEFENNITQFEPKTKVRTKIILELMPLIVIALLFTALISYTINTRIVGELSYKMHNAELTNLFDDTTFKDIDEIISTLQEKDVGQDNDYYIIKQDGSYITSNDAELSDFFVKYAMEEKDGNRVYDYYCVDREGTNVKVYTLDGNRYLVGVIYETGSSLFLIGIAISCLVLFVTIISTLIYIATNLSKDIISINDGLKNILQRKDINTKLIVTSNDETGELTENYNMIQKLTHDNIEEIQKNQEIIMIQNKFASVGELAAGMAHDINNPASSLDASIDLLTHFKVEEEKQQIYNELVNNMKLSNNKILSVVNNTQNQFRNISKTDKTLFSLNDMLNNLAVSEENDIAKVNGKINVYINETIQLYGIESRLYQVIMNLIRNSVLSYREKSLQGNVDINAKMDDNMCVISVTDTAGGIPEEVRDTIFKKILTTRGTKGTGLGLYLAAGIIEGDFKGTISFDTETGRGTTFYIRIPMDKGDNE